MSIAAVAVEKRVVTYFATFLVVVAGLVSFTSLGQLEDPEFTVKTAVIATAYPGASPEEVELEVTDRIETAIQELKQLKWVESFSRPGYSQVKVEILPTYWAKALPQVWDELRRKVREVETQLPPGTGRPQVFDDYGDVYGFQLALIGDGFNYAELEKFAKDIKKELSLVEGVARVDLVGVQEKVIYMDASQTQLSQLGLSDMSLETTLQYQNMVVDAGALDVQSKRFRIAPTGEFQSPTDIAELNVRPSVLDSILAEAEGRGFKIVDELLLIQDIGTISRGYRDPPSHLVRYNGQPAIGLSISNRSGVNIVEVGRAIDQRLDELAPDYPIGIEVYRVHWQSDIVDEAVQGFVVNFAEAVGIVLIVLTIVMGWRMGVIIGGALVVTVLGTFILMALLGIDLERMSLGALVIALGMMVDNAIVVADGMSVRLSKGMDRTKAAIEAATQPAWPLLGATVVAVMAFYPIAGSPESTGEYCRSLFIVVGASLSLSWFVSVTLTPLQCIDMLPAPEATEAEKDPFAGGIFLRFRNFLEWAIRRRVLTLGGMVVLLVVAIVGFGNVKQLFFPNSSMPKFMIDYWAPQGTRIQDVAGDLRQAETKLLTDERVASVASYIGQGPPRFYLPVSAEDPNPSYAQLIVNVHDYKDVRRVIRDFDPWFKEHYPDALVALREFGVGPGKTWKFEIRVSGPAVADPGTLRSLAAEYEAILDASPFAAYARNDWRQRVQKVVPEYSQARARWAEVTREDLANTTKRAFDGRQIGLYREGDDLIPILLRHVGEERRDVRAFDVLQIQPALATETVPLSQVVDGIVVQWEDDLIWRRDRRRTIKVQSNPAMGVTLPTLRQSVLAEFEAVELPPGYRMEWGGEWEDTVDSQAALIPGMVPAGVIMLFIIVALFNAFRPPLIILLTLPFAVIGITAGLLITNTPFGFMALLGAMSLSGMMIKNAIVLLDEVNLNLAGGKSPYDSVVYAALSRLRPVVLAAATTVLGVAPLLQDVFWIGMAVTIMAGLAFGTLLTMVLAPVLYATLYRIPSPQPAA